NSRQQFKKTLGNFDLVKKKIARMAADVYAMEAMTNVTASLIDRGLEDYMIETAMLKVFTTDRLWEAVNDAFQIHGGSAYFDDNPLGRMLRDARINQIGEGSNEVLTSFIALVGMRGPAMELFASTCVLSRWDAELRAAFRNGDSAPAQSAAPDLFLRQSFRRVRQFLDALGDNDDKALLATADLIFGKTA